MDFIRISDAKIKVTLSPEDMDRYVNEGERDRPAGSHGTLRAILREIRRETGFDATGERVLMQMFPASDGGCELFVTRLGKLPEDRPRDRAPLPAAAPPLRSAVFAFASLPPLLAVCRHLKHVGYPHLSAVYYGDDRLWYLVLQEPIPRDRPSPLSFAEEFGSRRRAAGALAYIKEHAACVSGSDAVAALASLA
ncbi:MAG: adaptor protein MecA [Clostridia bacterium]|nr:adaptor protein MecA [Clostridia bacterium]